MAHLTLVVSNDQPERAARGTGELLFQLGLLAEAAPGEPDLVSAHKWMSLAAIRGSAAARRYRRNLAQQMTDLEIAAAQAEVCRWLEQRSDRI